MKEKEIEEIADDLERTKAQRQRRGVADDDGAAERASGIRRLVSDEDQFRLLVDVVEDYAIIPLDASGRVTGWNDGARRIKGYEDAEVLGRHFALFYPLDDIKRGKAQAELAAAREVGRFEEEGWRVRKGGERFWAYVILTAVRDVTGTLRGFVKITRDLTERERARADRESLATTKSLLETSEQAKRDAEAAERRLLSLVSTMSDGYFTLDEQWRFAQANPSLARLLGKPGHDFIGESFWDEVTNSVHSNFFKHLPSLLTGNSQVEFVELHEPTQRWFSVRAHRSEGKIAVFLRDVTAEHESGRKRG